MAFEAEEGRLGSSSFRAATAATCPWPRGRGALLGRERSCVSIALSLLVQSALALSAADDAKSFGLLLSSPKVPPGVPVGPEPLRASMLGSLAL